MTASEIIYLTLLVWTGVFISAIKEQTLSKADEQTRSVNSEHFNSQTFTEAYEKKLTTNKHLKEKIFTKRNENTISSSKEHINSQMITTPYVNATLARRQNVIYEIAKKLCPYSDYCRRKKDLPLDYRNAPCCTDCSCEDSCWETGNCCPDKDLIVEQEPFRRCHASVVKAGKSKLVYNGLNHRILAYYVIDNCPESEHNISIINKCTFTDIDHINDYRWVSDNSSRKIYQNNFCAACHGKIGLTEWQVETRCQDLLLSNFSHLNSLILSSRCDIINREPETGVNDLYETCAIPFYTRCNQTGLWTKYDPDINWACEMHNSVYFVDKNRDIILYKNAFCYACNVPAIENTPTMCMDLQDDNNLYFSSLIDYKRYEKLSSDLSTPQMPCKVNEIMDQYMRKCRPLICPFGHAPYYGQCEQLLEQTHGLTLEVVLSLSALWSKVDYNLELNMSTFLLIGQEINGELLGRYVAEESGISCPYCNQSLRFVKDIVRSQTRHNYSASQTVGTANLTKSTEPNLLFHIISYTAKDCQLPYLLANSVKLAGTVIEINMDGGLLMLLQVGLVTENIQSLISGSTIITDTDSYPNCFVTFQMTREKTCPLIRISFSEFKPLMTERNAGNINDLFTVPKRMSEDFIEICVDYYFAKVGKSTFQLTRDMGSFEIPSKILILMCTVGTTQQLL